MDKFGIFNLLSTFLNSKNSTNPVDTDVFSGKPTEENAASSPSDAKKYSTPLQAGMLNTMYSHDAIVKRVMNKNK